MKFNHTSHSSAFTLTEIMIAMTIFTMLIGALVASQLFAMRMYQICQTKLVATSDGRHALNSIKNEIRSGKLFTVGNQNGSMFNPVANGSAQKGNALQISPTTDKTVFVRYYLDTDSKLKKLNSTDMTPVVIASFITNQMVFQVEDFQGTVLSNALNDCVVRMTLEFYQLEYPKAAIGHGGLYDYYRLQTCITPRKKE